jgi:hypothetical protein
VVPLPVTLATTPFTTVTSLLPNPVTDSLNVTVTGSGEDLVGEVSLDEKDTVGPVTSYVNERTDEAALVFPAESIATPSPTEISTAPSTIGDICAKYVLLSIAVRLEHVPLCTVISDASNPAIASENVIVTGMGDTFVIEPIPVLTSTEGDKISYVTSTSFETIFPLPAISATPPAPRDTRTIPSANGCTSNV